MEKRMLSLEISNELREALRKEAFIQNVSISKLIRTILEKELKINTTDKDNKTNG